MIRVGIVGCGRIADQHATEILKIPQSKIVGVCDREVLLAQQAAERFNVERYTTDVGELLGEMKPDVVHITTPPQSHYELGRQCLQAGCSIFVEKPFTINAGEAESLVRLAEQGGLRVTVGHNAQFSHAARRMRAMIQSGFLGGDPVHMESLWCYNFTDPVYAKALLGDSGHWIRSLPGKYLHDIISHGISRIAEFLKTGAPQVWAVGHVSPTMMGIGETDIIDELRVIIHDQDNTTAYFTFSSQFGPPIKQFRIYGPANSLVVDHEHQTLVSATENYRYYLNHFIPPFIDGQKCFANGFRNIWKFLRNDFYYESGRRYLIESFYKSVTGEGPPPIRPEEIVLTAKIVDEIFRQIYTAEGSPVPVGCNRAGHAE